MRSSDERDIIFARLGYFPQSEAYEHYYEKNPDRKETDDIFRQKGPSGDETAVMYHPIYSKVPDACFSFLSDMKEFVVGECASEKTAISKEEATKLLLNIAKLYGAKLVGVTKMTAEHYYTHKGRPLEKYGQQPSTKHKYGIAFAVEMPKDYINTAPRMPESIAVTKGYIDAAVIGMVLSYTIRELGYGARNHMDGSYDVVAPYVAEDAGIGEIGRLGLLLTKDYGARVRLGVVTTDLELEISEKRALGLKEYCEICQRCATSCPGRALKKNASCDKNGDYAWVTDTDACFAAWQRLGTDCGVCLASCPFSQGAAVGKDLTVKENREELLHHLDKVMPQRIYLKDFPEWM